MNFIKSTFNLLKRAWAAVAAVAFVELWESKDIKFDKDDQMSLNNPYRTHFEFDDDRIRF